MSLVSLSIEDLPDGPIDAAAAYYAHWAARAHTLASAAETQLLVLIFDAGDYTHAEWRRVAVAALARTLAPRRVCAIAGGDATARAATLAFLDRAPGVTGQYLELAD